MPKEKKPNPHQGHRDRMREKIKNYGINDLPQHEVLEFILYHLIPRKDTNPIAHELIDKFGNFQNVVEASPEMLADVKNMTENAAVFLSIIPQISRLYTQQKFGDKPILDTIPHAVEYFRNLFVGEKGEAMYMLILNAKGMLLSSSKIGAGNLENCQINVRKFIMRTVDSEGSCIMIAHNHPSGSPLPSYEDCEFTRWLISVGEVLGIAVSDHIIIANEGYYSFRENDMLANYAGTFKEYMKKAEASDKYSMNISKFKDKT